MKNFDIVIVGGGLGGLIAGAKLSKEGKKVLLIEQHYIPGGCATAFKRKDFVFEVGLHAMDGLDEEDPKVEIFKDLEVFDNIKFLQINEFYKFANAKYDLVIPDNYKEAIDLLTQKFPQEKKGIRIFFNTILGIRKEVNKMAVKNLIKNFLLPIYPFLFPKTVANMSQTLGDFLDKIINDEELKLILAANVGYYHDDPYSMSLLYFSAAQGSYFKGGGHFIQGGSQMLSNFLAQSIRNNGGSVLLGHKALKILFENDKIAGVEFRNTYDENSVSQVAFAQTVIMNGAVPSVVNMLPENKQEILRNKVEKYNTSCSLLTIYIGFKRRLKDLGSKNYSTFVFDNEIENLKQFADGIKGDIKRKGFTFVDYSQIDSQLTVEGKSVGVICTIDYLKDWKHLNEEDYKVKKEMIAQCFLKKLEKLIPGVSKEIDYYEVGTAKTIHHYTLNTEGSVYGYSQVPKQAGLNRLKNKSPIKNLYFASAWSMPGGGFTGAIFSGWYCAKEILSKKSYRNVNEITSYSADFENTKISLVKKNQVANNTFEFEFKKPTNFSFISGQYVVLKLDKEIKTKAEMNIRSLSIASHPSEDLLRFTLRAGHSGFKQCLLSMTDGDTAEIYGPMGKFSLIDDEKDIVFLASGIGVTPILSMLKELHFRSSQKNILFFYSNKTKLDTAYFDYFKNLNLKNYTFIPIFSQTQGRIDNILLSKYIQSFKNFRYYICGSSGFVSNMKNIVSQKQVDESDVLVDDFG